MDASAPSQQSHPATTEATQLDLVFGWAALLSAVATIGTLITGILFFAVNERLGKINPVAGLSCKVGRG